MIVQLKKKRKRKKKKNNNNKCIGNNFMVGWFVGRLGFMVFQHL